METQSFTPEEFSKKLTEELVKVGKTAPADILKLDMEGSMTDPIGWIMKNTMRIEMARLVFYESVYKKFATTGQKRQTADLLISSSRAMAASLLRDVIRKSAGADIDPSRLAFILGVDASALDITPVHNLRETHGKVSDNPDSGAAKNDPASPGAQS